MRLLFLLIPCALLLAGCGSAPAPKEEKAATPPASEPPKILMFYPGTPTMERGRGGLLCYGVENAKEVKITPAVEELRPSPNRCFEVKPERTTEYTLEARDAQGRSTTKSVRVEVVAATRHAESAGGSNEGTAAGPQILSFRLEKRDGSSANLCYEVAGVQTVTVEPAALPTVHAQRGCFLVAPTSTTTYTLKAAVSGGRSLTKTLTVTVP